MTRNQSVYAQTNDASANEVLAFRRDADGKLSSGDRYPTGGRGTGKPHLASQNSVVVSSDGEWLLVVNAGSAEVTLFAIEADGLRLADRVGSGGTAPTSVAVHGSLVYVLNNGSASVTGFRLAERRLEPLPGSERQLSSPDADGAQVAFSPDGRTLVVTERGTNSISAFAVAGDGSLEGPTTIASAGATPYGFDFAGDALVVTEAFGGAAGAAAASSYTVSGAGRLAHVSGSVADTRSEVCWAVISRDGRYAFVTNFGDGTISSYRVGPDGELELLEAVAASTRMGEKGVRDEALTPDGRFLYAIDADAQRVFAWKVGGAGELSPVGELGGLPETVAGLAAS
jgi:6-phosphogluconolactonase (cycloisomerase 2 family)